MTALLLFAAEVPSRADDVLESDLLALAAAALEAGEAKRALKAYEQAAGHAELRTEALLGVARAQNRLRRRGKALAATEAAIESSSSADEEAMAHDVAGLVQAGMALDLLIDVERLSDRPGKKKPTYREEVDQHIALAEAEHRRALELTDGAMPEAWRNLANLLAAAGRFGEARDELVLFFERDPDGRAFAADVLAHLECVSDVADLDDVARPDDRSVTPAVKQFHPSPRWSGEGKLGAVRAIGVVDRQGRFRCVRIAKRHDLPAEAERLYLATLATWRFAPASIDGKRVSAFYGVTVEAFEPP